MIGHRPGPGGKGSPRGFFALRCIHFQERKPKLATRGTAAATRFMVMSSIFVKGKYEQLRWG